MRYFILETTHRTLDSVHDVIAFFVHKRHADRCCAMLNAHAKSSQTYAVCEVEMLQGELN